MESKYAFGAARRTTGDDTIVNQGSEMRLRHVGRGSAPVAIAACKARKPPLNRNEAA
jgi:hypothetical protein